MITKEFKLTVKSQVTIPEKVKEILHINPGDAIFFNIKNGHVEICPFKENQISIFDLGKKYRINSKKRISIEDMNKVIRSKQRTIALNNTNSTN